MTQFIHLIADYGDGDPAFSEVVHRLQAEDPSLTVQTTAVEPLSTIATGFWIEQLSLHNPPFDELLVYSNTAPRIEEAGASQADEGGQLCYLRLRNGVPVVAVDAGHNLSFIQNHVEESREVVLPSATGQFRSRDSFPKRVVAIANGDLTSLGSDYSLSHVPPPPEVAVCHVDGYGNIKTSIKASEFELGRSECVVALNGKMREVAIRDGVSEVKVGRVGMVPGSAGGDDPYMELFLRGGSVLSGKDFVGIISRTIDRMK